MSESRDALIARIEREWNLIRGRTFGLIESWGLPTKQETGAKSAFKSLTFDAQARMIDLVADDGLRLALNTVADGIAELEECERIVAGEAKLAEADEREQLEYVSDFISDRIEELRAHQADLQHLERLNSVVGSRS